MNRALRLKKVTSKPGWWLRWQVLAGQHDLLVVLAEDHPEPAEVHPGRPVLALGVDARNSRCRPAPYVALSPFATADSPGLHPLRVDPFAPDSPVRVMNLGREQVGGRGTEGIEPDLRRHALAVLQGDRHWPPGLGAVEPGQLVVDQEQRVARRGRGDEAEGVVVLQRVTVPTGEARRTTTLTDEPSPKLLLGVNRISCGVGPCEKVPGTAGSAEK